MRRRLFVVGTIAILVSACAKRVPEPVNVAPGTPHVTWTLMYGDRYANAEDKLVCQSDPRTECVLPASRPGAQVFAHLHTYYHGAGAETRYEGTTTHGFLEGEPNAHTSQTKISVSKTESITNQSVTGIVTSKPGGYTMSWYLTATVVDTGKTYPVRDTIQVTVK